MFTSACIRAVCLCVVFSLIFMFLMYVLSSTGCEVCRTCIIHEADEVCWFVVGKLDITASETPAWMPG